MPTILLINQDVRSLLSMASVIEAVEQAFRDLAFGKAKMPAKAYLTQACAAGEINVPLSKGLIMEEDIYGTLSEVITGRKKGRKDGKAVTIFDSTGIAIEDIAVARLIYEKARQTDAYLKVDFIG